MKHSTFLKIALLSIILTPFAHAMKRKKPKNDFFSYIEAQDIHLATVDGKLELVNELIELNPANIEALTIDKETPLHIAARHGNIKVIKYLLKQGANKRARNKHNETPLQLAVKNNHPEIVRLLLKTCFAQLFKVNKMGETILHIAAQNNNTEIIEIILEAFKDHQKLLKKYLEKKTKEGLTALHIACYYGKEDAVKVLLSWGANIEAVATTKKDDHRDDNNQDNENQNLRCTPDYHSDSDSDTTNEDTQKNNQEEFQIFGRELIIDNDSDSDSENSEDEMFEPAHNNNNNDEDEGCCCCCCCECNCKPYGNGETPLILATLGRYANLVEFLLLQQANIDAQDDYGNTALHLIKDISIAKILLKYNAFMNAQNTQGETPLHMSYNNELLKFFIQNGANINAQDQSKYTPLHYAALHGKTNCVKTLIDFDANLEAQTIDDYTPLHITVTDCQSSNHVIHKLIRQGASFELEAVVSADGTIEHDIVIEGSSMKILSKQVQKILEHYETYRYHFENCIKKYLFKNKGKKTIVTYIKKLFFSDKVPTFIKKAALPIFLEMCTKKELVDMFAQISFDSSFLTEILYIDALKYAIKHELKDINNRTVTDATRILDIRKKFVNQIKKEFIEEEIRKKIKMKKFSDLIIKVVKKEK